MIGKIFSAVRHWTGMYPHQTGSKSEWDSSTSSSRRADVPGGGVRDWKAAVSWPAQKEMIRRSRYLDKSNGFYSESMSDMALYAVGTGIRPQSQVEDKTIANLYEEYFETWASNCMLNGEFTLPELEFLLCRTIDLDGEIYIIRVRNADGEPRLQVIETHRLSGRTEPDNYIFSGVRLDRVTGRRVEYFFIGDDGAEISVPAWRVWPVFEPKWISALRYPPTGQHGFNHMLDEQELLDLEKTAVKDSAETSRVLKSDRETAIDDGDFNIAGEVGDEEGSPTNPDEVRRRIGGKVARINTDETMESFRSERPNSTFTGFLEHLMRNAQSGGLPYEVVRDARGIGGAVVRMVVAKSDRRAKFRTHVIITRVLRKSWFWVIGDGIDRGLLPAEKGWNKVRWTPPRSITVDAGRDSRENRNDIDFGTKTLEEDYSERGLDFEEQLEIRKNNARSILRAADVPDSEPIPLWMLYRPSNAPLVMDDKEGRDPEDKDDE